MLSYNVKIIDVLHNQDEKFKYENPIHFWTALLKNSKYSAGYLYNALETRPGLQSVLYERLSQWIVKKYIKPRWDSSMQASNQLPRSLESLTKKSTTTISKARIVSTSHLDSILRKLEVAQIRRSFIPQFL
eukprot:TRINITY_DN1452_c0_g1_i3.p1 TRINITY_DN1452_c0_g1~~TRINITY_DN1452_c0_g1_i3.p1  ORF type:complete len:131 (-),score=16.46 TRINITY_DN1452_c0_g1_i3:234-626(-)